MPLILEDFGSSPQRDPTRQNAAPDTAGEEDRLVSFEAGYRAGWDDAVTAQADQDAEIRTDIARNLQGLAFTYHEARSHVLRALTLLVAELATRLLPEIAHAALPHLVAEALTPYVEIAAEAPVRVVLHPSIRQRVEAMVGTTPGLPIAYHEDDGLPPGQIWLALGETETRVDIDAALATIRAALDDFFTLAAKESRHG